ncbi:MAG: hypothetical protein ACI8UC_001874 [Psychromonas sp.]|jgi:hypothetical protein
MKNFDISAILIIMITFILFVAAFFSLVLRMIFC